MARSAAEIIDEYLSVTGSAADLQSGLATLSMGMSPEEQRDAAIDFAQAASGLLVLFREAPLVGGAIDTASLANNLAKVNRDIETLGYIDDATYAGVLSDVGSIFSAGAKLKGSGSNCFQGPCTGFV
jgi:hypothetical protein